MFEMLYIIKIDTFWLWASLLYYDDIVYFMFNNHYLIFKFFTN